MDVDKIITIWKRYMAEEGHQVTQAEFLQNMELKIKDHDFAGDIQGLLRAGIFL